MNESTITITYRGGEADDETAAVLTFFPASGKIVTTTSRSGMASTTFRLSRWRARILTGLLFGIAGGIVKVLKGETDQDRDSDPAVSREWPEIFEEAAEWPETIDRGEIS